MSWNKVDLPVEQIYGKLDLGFMPIFNKAIKVFKDSGYKRILDLGCGYGKHSIYLSQNGFNVTSIDINKQAIEWLKKYIDANHVSNINVIKADINDLPFKNDYFDGIICSSVIHHQGLKEIKNSISEMYRVLKPNGYILVNFMSIDYFAPSGPPIRMDESFDIQLESIYPHIGSTKKATLSCKRGVYGYIKLMIICLF